MARRTRGNVLLNAYMNRYVNDQASAVNSGENNIASKASQGEKQISAVPTDLPELTDFSENIYSGILNQEKERQETYKKAVEEAQKAAEAAAAAAAKSASRSSSRSRSSSSSGTSKKQDNTVKAQLPTDKEKGKKTQKSPLKKNQGKNLSASQALGGSAQQEEDKTVSSNTDSAGNTRKTNTAKSESAKTASTSTLTAPASSYAAASGTSPKVTGTSSKTAKTTTTPASSYAAASGISDKSRKEIEEAAEKRAAERENEKKETLVNLQSDPEYFVQLSQPGVRLTKSQIEAAKEYLKTAPDNFDLLDQYESGELSFKEYNQLANARSALEQKISLGGLGQNLQAFTAGMYNSVPFIETIDDAYTDWADKETGGKYSETVPESMTDTLQGYEQQSPVFGMAGRFAGNAALYGAANAALEGTAFANAAASAGGKAASALKSVPGIGNLVTEGTGAAIGNVITGQAADLALDTIPSLTKDVYSYANGNPDDLTPGKIAANTAQNFGVNLAMNVGSEAIPAVFRAGKNALSNAINPTVAAESVADVVKQPTVDDLVRSWEAEDAKYISGIDRNKVNQLVDEWNLDDAEFETGINQRKVRELVNNWAQEDADAARPSINREKINELASAWDAEDSVLNQQVKNDLSEYDSILKDMNNSFGSSDNSVPGFEIQEFSPVENISSQPSRTLTVLDPYTVQEANPQQAIPLNEAAPTETIPLDDPEEMFSLDHPFLDDLGLEDTYFQIPESGTPKAQQITGKSSKSRYTREIENIFDRIASGEPAESLEEEAERIAKSIYKPADFTETTEADPAIKTLREYLKSTPIKIGDKEAGDLLSASGYKSVSAYNKANGTKFSVNNGVDWDSAVQELNGMNVGVAGDTFDDLLQAIDRSKTRAEKSFDEDLYSTYTDYVKDNILSGRDNSESFEDWLERKGFDYQDMPEYQQRAYDRWSNGTLDLPQTSVDGLPEYGVGAKKSDFDRSVVPNRDYAGQAAARLGLDDAHAAQIGTYEHQVWTDAEAKKQAADDVSLYIQEAGGDFDKAMNNAISDLTQNENWNKGDIKTAQEVRDRLKVQYNESLEGTPEFYKNAARYESFTRTYSGRASESGLNLQSFKEEAITAETGIRKMYQVSDEIGKKWAEGNVKENEKIRQLSEELNALRKKWDERNIADMEEEAMRGAFENTPSGNSAGNMNAEFDEFLKEQNVKTDPTQAFNDLVSSVKELGKKYNIEISDETAKNLAGKIQAGLSTESYYNKLLNEAAGITDLSLDEMEIIDDLYSKAATLPDSKERYELEQKALQIIASHLPAKTWFERFDNFRYLAMLGNTRTHVRNLLGNVAMSAVTKAKDEVAAAYQLALPKSQRTKSLYTPKEMKDAARQYLNEQAYSTIRGGSKYNLAQGLEAARKTYGESFGGRVLQKLSDLNSAALEKEDQVFLESAFVRSLSSNLTAKGFDTSIFSATDDVSKAVLENAVNQAVIDAKEATFRSDNAISRMLGKVSNLGDKKGNLGEKIGYIIGNGLLPFTKTPANILKTSLEYNPVGGIVEAVYRGKTGKGSAAVMDALSKGTVGTGIIGLGWYLADAGLVQGSVDEETGKYDETLGTQNYSLVIPGKGSYTIDWASPAAVPFLIGANLSQEGADLQDVLDNPEKYASQFGDIMLQALDPVSEMSLLSGVEDTLNAVRYSDNSALLGIGKDLATSYAQQFVPTVFGQVSRAIDPVRRSTYGGGDTQTERDNSYLLRSTLNKIPGLSENSEPYIDQWGRTEASLDGTGNNAGGIAKRLAYNMLSPGYYSAENVTPVDSYIQSLYDSTGDSGVIPELAPNYIEKDGKQYFTPEQKTTYATTSGQLSYSMLDELQSNPAFTGLSESDQADIVKDVYDLAKEVGASTAIPSLDYSDSKELKVYQSSGQTGAINYFLAKAASDNARAEKQSSTGNESASLTDSEKWNAISNSGMNEEDAVSTYLSMNDDEKASKIYSQYGSSATADWMDYMYNYKYAYNQAKAEATKTGDKVSQQGIAESVLDQMGFDTETKRLFWQMTGSNWSEKNNPY